MILRNNKPNDYTFNILVSAYCKEGKVKQAFNVLAMMIAEGVKPDVVTYNALMDGYCVVNQVNKAKVIFNTMAQRRVMPDVLSYNVMINGLCKIGMMDEAINFFKEMQSKKVIPSTVTYNSLINGLCKIEMIDEAMNLFKEMQSKKIILNTLTYNTLIDGLCKLGRIYHAWELHDEMHDRGQPADVISYTSLLHALCKNHHVGKAIALIKKIEDQGILPDVHAEIVEKSRVRRAYKGENAPQIGVKSLSHEEPSLSSDITNVEVDTQASEGFDISWLGSTNLAVGASQFATNAVDVDCILNCDRESISVSLPSAEAYLHLPMVSSKFDRFSLLNNLPKAVSFAKLNLNQGKRLLVCCNNGEDISVCVCLSILMSLFDEQGTFDDGNSFNTTNVTKWDMRRRLVFVCKFATNARPSRGNLRQVFNFLIGGKCNLQLQEDDGSDE